MSAQPARPVALDPDLAYIHITSNLSPADISSATAKTESNYQLSYVGPVGELSGEHIFAVHHGKNVGSHSATVVKRDDQEWKKNQNQVISGLKGLQGVKGAKMMEMKQRTKREL